MPNREPLRPTAAELKALARRDPALGAAMRRLPPYPGFPSPGTRRESHFRSLARSIVYQQLTGKAAATIHRRAAALTPGPGFPRPEELLALPDEALRGAGLSRPKVAALRDLATRSLDGRLRLRGLGRLEDDAIVERLVTVRGIGVWSAQMFLVFKLGRLDVMAAGDLGVREGARILDGLKERPDADSVLRRAEVWRPLRTIACWTLWRLVEESR